MHLVHDPDAAAAPTIAFSDFLGVDIRVGTIVSAIAVPEARNPAYKLVIDFGTAIGLKSSCAQITEHYALKDLPGRQVAAVVNLPARQVGKHMSDVLTLGFGDTAGAVVLFAPDHPVPNGSRLF